MPNAAREQPEVVRHRLGAAASTLAGATLVLATFLPWLRSGRADRTSHEVLDLLDRLGLAPDGAVALLVEAWPLLPLTVTAAVVARWSRRDVAAVVLALVAAAHATVVSVAVLRVGRSGLVTVRSGPWICLAGGIGLALTTIPPLVAAVRANPPSPTSTRRRAAGTVAAMPTRDEALALLTAPGSPFEIAEQEVHGQRIRVYPNAPATLREVWEATAAHGEATYLVYEDERTSYAEAHAAVRVLAAALADGGVGRGDRVAIGMRNYPEWVLAFWACQSLGAVVVSLNAWWTGAELEYGLNDSGAAALVVDGERYDRLRGDVLSRTGVRLVVVARADGPLEQGHLAWTDVLAAADPGRLPDVEIGRDDDSTILYTSGTTGEPKGAVGSHRNHVTNITNTILNGALNAVMASGPDAPAAAPAGRAVALWTFPFFHIAGVTGICVMTATGGQIVTQYKFDADAALDLIERERVTVVAGVPTVIRTLLEHPGAASHDLSSLAGISQGGSPVPPDSIAKIESEFAGKVSPANGYGLTETTSAVIANSGATYFAKKDSVGLPMPVTDVRVVGDDGEDAPPGEIGELWVRGPNNVRGYWNKPAATAAAFVDGWFRTGDAGRIDDDGYVYVVDRLKDMVLRGGENVYCAEVEAAMFEHPDVADVAVFGLPHDRLGEEVAAAVLVKPGRTTTPAELQRALDGRLAPFKIPSTIVIRAEELPRNATGKVLKKDLRDLYRTSGTGRR